MNEPLALNILPQPDDVTCGPTCLHAVYRYYGDPVSLEEVVQRTPQLEDGGTLAVLLGCDALKNGYDATIYTYNLTVFDPTWFRYSDAHLVDKIRSQLLHKDSPKLHTASRGYLEFLSLGGQLRMRDLNRDLIVEHLNQSVPVLTGLSSTYLYQERRELNTTQEPDDVRGTPQGHFVVLRGYNREKKMVRVADPYQKNPWSKNLDYEVPIERVICAILLGVLTYDANLLVIRPKSKPLEDEHPHERLNSSPPAASKPE